MFEQRKEYTVSSMKQQKDMEHYGFIACCTEIFGVVASGTKEGSDLHNSKTSDLGNQSDVQPALCASADAIGKWNTALPATLLLYAVREKINEPIHHHHYLQCCLSEA